MTNEFLLIKTLEELESYGSIEDIKDELKSYLPASAKLEADTYKALMEDVNWISKSYIQEGQIFTSEKQEHIYYLLEHSNGKERKQKLGVKDSFYELDGAGEARRWRNRIGHILRADLNDNDRAKDAFIKLDSMYQEMTQLEVEGEDDEPLVVSPFESDEHQEG